MPRLAPSSRRSRAAEDIDDAISWLCAEARFVAGIAGDRVRHEGQLVSPAANRPFGSAGGATRS